MSATLLADANVAQVHHADWRALLDVVPACDLLCVDAPYSERTHRGHDFGNTRAVDGADRRDLGYCPWTGEDVREFVEAWSPRCTGWFVTITDHVLAPAWEAALAAAGRYTFPPLPYYAPGSRVRRAGDGPSCWMTPIVVARPRARRFLGWGTLPGGYALPPGYSERMPVVGGKPTWLLSELVKDYSRPGDLCVDPCCGAGTLAVAAIRNGRRAVVGDVLRAHADLAATWIANPWRKAPHLDERDAPAGQVSLFGAAQ